MLYAISVNYGSPEVIQDWSQSIRSEHPDAKLILIDNFHSEAVRATTQEICDGAGITMIPQDNIGYGRGLNVGLATVQRDPSLQDDDIIIFGNIDLNCSKIAVPKIDKPAAFMPRVLQDGKSRNPFLTRLQSRFLPLYDIAAALQSPIALRLVAGVIKVIGKLPSAAYATHGSLFVVNGAGLKAITLPLFNEASFLYCEELEFAEVLRRDGLVLTGCDLEVRHIGRVSTGEVTKTTADFLKIWRPSWQNWRKRW